MPNFQTACRATAVALLLWAGISPAFASVVLNGTRVIYQEPQREVSLRATNDGTTPSLVQAWIDAGNPDAPPDDAAVPFLLTPPLFRVNPGDGQTMRIILAGDPPPRLAAKRFTGSMSLRFRPWSPLTMRHATL